jgi:transcriptional regulator GlxA family with amidase domain
MQVGQTAAARSLRGFLIYFFAELRHEDSPCRRPESSAGIRAMVTDMVHALSDAQAPLPGSDASAGARVRKACDYMRAYADEALTMEQVASAVGIGSRSLQAAFRDTLGMTPREILAEIRLENARARLLAPEPATTVTSAALECGFVHLGRFAAAYRHRYGESPSETLRRALH